MVPYWHLDAIQANDPPKEKAHAVILILNRFTHSNISTREQASPVRKLLRK